MSIHVLYPFNFTSSVYFGDTVLGGQLDTVTLTCGADTLFSALCNEASWQSNGLVEYFIDQIRQGHISFSSLFPYIQNDEGYEFYLPKPIITIDRDEPVASYETMKVRATEAKKIKKVNFIRASQVYDYIVGKPLELQEPEFAVMQVTDAVNCRGEQPLPYAVGSYKFSERAGLYCIASFDTADNQTLFENLLVSLSHTGIGGKRSCGYGQFTLDVEEDPIILVDGEEIVGLYDDDIAIAHMLNLDDAALYLVVAPYIPTTESIDIIKNSTYGLVKKGGFTFSTQGMVPRKKNSVYMVKEGSCMRDIIEGQLVEMPIVHMPHQIYKYGIGKLLGVHDE